MTTPVVEVDGPIGYVTDLEGNVELWNRFIQCLGNMRILGHGNER